MDFEWDPAKAAQNLRKHGISFAEAASAFADTLSITVHDPDHSQEEDRRLLIGRSGRGISLIVAHVERGERIRSISARRLSRTEKKIYEETLDTRS